MTPDLPLVAFDSDVLIFAAEAGHPNGERVEALLDAPTLAGHRLGSTLLVPEVLIKPTRLGANAVRPDELTRLKQALARLELLPLDRPTALLAVEFGARYGLKAPDAVHLATAVRAGADYFLTNNRKDFRADEVLELAVIYPDALPPDLTL